MSRNSSTMPGIHERQRILSSPVALAFVRIVTARRGLTEAKARQIYLDYICRTKSAVDRGKRQSA